MTFLPYAITFAENHEPKYRDLSGNIRDIPGLILRHTWNWTAFIIVLSFNGILKATLINLSEPPLLKTHEDVMASKTPLVLAYVSEELYDQLQFSPLRIEQWMHENAAHVFYYNKYLLVFFA